MKEEFVRDAIRFRLTWLKGDSICVEIPKDEYSLLDDAVKEMRTPFHNADDFINTQIKETLQKYQEWKEPPKRR